MSLSDFEAGAAEPRNGTTPAGCTIIARNYLSHALILAESYTTHEPDATFYILIVDGVPDWLHGNNGIRFIEPDELGYARFWETCFKYDITELSTAVKPRFLSILLDNYGEEKVVYFDPDILIMRPLTELRKVMGTSNIVLTPHLSTPIPLDGRRPSEQDILLAGTYNLGFLAIRKSDEVTKFLQWWEERLDDLCLIDTARGLFVDQRWVDLIPGFFSAVAILRDETYNVAYWNLHSRRLEQLGGQFAVNGQPLAFFHFSGFNPTKRDELSKHQDRMGVQGGTPLAELLNLYADLHVKVGYREYSQLPYGHGHFSNGIAIPSFVRRLYLSLNKSARVRFGNPFLSVGSNSFFFWTTQPQEGEGGLSPAHVALYRARQDIVAVYPDPKGQDRERFLDWAGKWAPLEMGFDPRITNLGEVSQMKRAAPTCTITSDGIVVPSKVTPTGVNVVGYLRAESGLGSAVRAYVRAMKAEQIPVALIDVSDLTVLRTEDRTLITQNDEQKHSVNLFCVNADQHFEVMSHLGERFFDGHYNIGLWFWELPNFPEQWMDRFAYYDEIWVGSSFVANAIAPVSPIPIVRIPPPLTVSVTGSRDAGRKRLEVTSEEWVYLFIFDFHSFIERKNPYAVIEAFKRAFTPSDSVRLVIKCVNEQVNLAAFDAMKTQAEGSAISIYSGYWSSGDMQDLMAACDVYVSLHRSEGTGLTISEAMALGKPVIATGWSGNIDFMNLSNSYPVAYRLVEIKDNIGPYTSGSHWAEPSVAHAAQLMRHVFEDRAEALCRGAESKRTIEDSFSDTQVGNLIRRRLDVIAREKLETRRDSVGVAMPTDLPENGVTESSVDVRTANEQQGLVAKVPVVPPMDLTGSVHGVFGRFVKRLVNPLIGYHTWYQQNLNNTFADFLGVLAREHADIAGLVQVQQEQIAQAKGKLAALDRDFELTRRQVGDLAQIKRDLELTRQQVDGMAAVSQATSERVGSHDASIRTIADDLRNNVNGLILRADAVEQRLSSVSDDVAQIGYRFAARPYMATDVFGAAGDKSKPMGYGLDAACLSSSPPGDEFIDVFRGTEEFIMNRQRVYLPFFNGLEKVLDLGCGRGEFLKVLADNGTHAIGVDSDPEMVRRCRERGMEAIENDALSHLRGVEPGAVDAIFSAQLIEHLDQKEIEELLSLARRALRDGGIFIAETVNPECYEALKVFYVDLTHQRPIFPQVLLHLCRSTGFRSARVFYPTAGGFTQENYQQAGEYAVIAVV